MRWVLRLAATGAVAGTVAGAWWVWQDAPGGRALWQRATAELDRVLGVDRLKAPSRPAEPRPVVARSPHPPASAPVAPKPAPPYVDRSPRPSAVERLSDKDRAWLDHVVASKSSKPKP